MGGVGGASSYEQGREARMAIMRLNTSRLAVPCASQVLSVMQKGVRVVQSICADSKTRAALPLSSKARAALPPGMLSRHCPATARMLSAAVS